MPVRARSGRLRGRSVLRSKTIFDGAFARARRALRGETRRAPARAVADSVAIAEPVFKEWSDEGSEQWLLHLALDVSEGGTLKAWVTAETVDALLEHVPEARRWAYLMQTVPKVCTGLIVGPIVGLYHRSPTSCRVH
jgi:hypothetical protein